MGLEYRPVQRTPGDDANGVDPNAELTAAAGTALHETEEIARWRQVWRSQVSEDFDFYITRRYGQRLARWCAQLQSFMDQFDDVAELRALPALTALQRLLQRHTDLGTDEPLRATDEVLQLQGVDIDIDLAAMHVALYEGNGLRITFERHVAYIQVAAWHNRVFWHYRRRLNVAEGLARRRAMDELLHSARDASPKRSYWRMVVQAGQRLYQLSRSMGAGVLLMHEQDYGAGCRCVYSFFFFFFLPCAHSLTILFFIYTMSIRKNDKNEK